MSNRIVLGTTVAPDWADAASDSGKALAEDQFAIPSLKLFVMPNVSRAELAAFYDHTSFGNDIWFVYLAWGTDRQQSLECPTPEQALAAFDKLAGTP